jgi:hypothetical protein
MRQEFLDNVRNTFSSAIYREIFNEINSDNNTLDDVRFTLKELVKKANVINF